MIRISQSKGTTGLKKNASIGRILSQAGITCATHSRPRITMNLKIPNTFSLYGTCPEIGTSNRNQSKIKGHLSFLHPCGHGAGHHLTVIVFRGGKGRLGRGQVSRDHTVISWQTKIPYEITMRKLCENYARLGPLQLKV